MTLDEEILHAEEVAKENERKCTDGQLWDVNEKRRKCSAEHRQLAEWLKDYKRLKEQKPCDKCVYSTKDGYCQYDDITETIPPLEPCENAISREDALMALTGEWTELTDEIIHRFIKRIKKLPPVNPQTKTGHCKDCKYFDYDYMANVDGIPIIVAHELCSRWGDGCKTKEDGYCFLFEPKE